MSKPAKKKAIPTPSVPLTPKEMEKPELEMPSPEVERPKQTQPKLTGYGNFRIDCPRQNRSLLCENAQVEQEVKILVGRLEKNGEIIIKRLE